FGRRFGDRARQKPVAATVTPMSVTLPVLDGKVALITGAASGQGRAASLLFAEHGAKILVADVDAPGAAQTVKLVEALGREGVAAYGPAKAGLVGLTRQIAVEYGPKVRANVIAPGSIDTPRFRKVVADMDDGDQFLEGMLANVPMRRLGLAEDVARIALFLV